MSKKVFPLLSPADGEKAQPILDELKKKGFQIAAQGDQNAPVLLMLSAAFAGDESAQEAFFAADGAGREIIPVDLDGAAQPELVRSALMAKNAIATQGRTVEEIAKRVASAGAFAIKKTSKRLTGVLIAAAVLLVVGAGLWLLRGAGKESSVPEEPTPASVEATPAAPVELGFGLTAEDLAQVGGVVVMGGEFSHYASGETHDWKSYVYEDWDWDYYGNAKKVYRSTADGSALKRVSFDDLSLLAQMPNLTELTLICADIGTLPDLRGAAALESLTLVNCGGIGDLDWVAGSGLKEFVCIGTPVGDFRGLNDCEGLQSAELKFWDLRSSEVDLSGFGPRALRSLSIEGSFGGSNLFALSNCSELEEFRAYGLGDLRDLFFLYGKESLRVLDLEEVSGLQDISALETLGGLEELWLWNSGHISDYSPLAGCTALRELHVGFDGEGSPEIDLSFLANMTQLRVIEMYTNITQSYLSEGIVTEKARLHDLDFLKACQGGKEGLSLSLGLAAEDYSGLAEVKHFKHLSLDSNLGGKSLNQLLALMRGSEIDSLNLSLGSLVVGMYSEYVEVYQELDLKSLPESVRRLSINYGSMRDLSGLNENIESLSLWYCPYLHSLKGIENTALVQSGAGELEFVNCTGLYDWSALEGAALSKLSLRELTSLPEKERFSAGSLLLEKIGWSDGDGFIAGFVQNGTTRCEALSLVGVEGLHDLLPLYRLEGIGTLTVSPNLREQAEALKADGVAENSTVDYSAENWDPESLSISLESLEEIQTMPPSRLAHVKSLTLFGDSVVNMEGYQVFARGGVPCLRNEETDEETRAKPGKLSSMSELSALTGLQELTLYYQPLTSLEGIEALTELKTVTLRCCNRLKDISPLFTMQQIESLDLWLTPVGSLRGIENLQELRSLDLAYTKITDLTPLLALDKLQVVQINSRLSQAIASLEGKDYTFYLSIYG